MRVPERRFEPGDIALHASGTLDPREVVSVSEDGLAIRIWLVTRESEEWFPAENYTNLGPRKISRA